MFKFLLGGSIDSWFEICETFFAHFIATKLQSTTMVALSGVIQGKKKTLCA